MRSRFYHKRENPEMREHAVWMQKLQKWFPQETLRRFFERQDVRRISLAVVMAISGCTAKVPDIVTPPKAETKELIKKPTPKQGERLERKLPPDFKSETTTLFEIIRAFSDEDLARAKVSREELANALTQLRHVFVKYGGRDVPYPVIETRLFRDGIRYFVKWNDNKERPFGSDDATSAADEGMQELHERMQGLINIQRASSEEEANVVFTFRGFEADEVYAGKGNVGGVTHIIFEKRKLPLLGEYMENSFKDVEFNLDKNLTDPKTQNIVLENKTGKEFAGIESLPRDVQRDIYKAYFKKAALHEAIHRLLGFMDHNDEILSSIMNAIAHVLLTLSEEASDGEKKLKTHIATDMEDEADPVNPLLRVIWLVLDKVGALKKDFVPEEVARSVQYIVGPIPIDKHSESL